METLNFTALSHCIISLEVKSSLQEHLHLWQKLFVLANIFHSLNDSLGVKLRDESSLLCWSNYIIRKICITYMVRTLILRFLDSNNALNPLNAELNPICHLLALLGAHHILHVSRIRVKLRCCSRSVYKF